MAEREVHKLNMHNKSLIGTVNMLKGIIQLNVQKEQDAGLDLPSHAALEDEVKRFRAEAKSASKPVDTILGSRTTTKTSQEQSQANGEQCDTGPKQPNEDHNAHVQDITELFNFDMLNVSNDAEDPAKAGGGHRSQGRCDLNSQSASDIKKKTSTTSLATDGVLIPITPEKVQVDWTDLAISHSSLIAPSGITAKSRSTSSGTSNKQATELLRGKILYDPPSSCEEPTSKVSLLSSFFY